MKGKYQLSVSGPADPTGCGEGFSYTRLNTRVRWEWRRRKKGWRVEGVEERRGEGRKEAEVRRREKEGRRRREVGRRGEREEEREGGKRRRGEKVSSYSGLLTPVFVTWVRRPGYWARGKEVSRCSNVSPLGVCSYHN